MALLRLRRDAASTRPALKHFSEDVGLEKPLFALGSPADRELYLIKKRLGDNRLVLPFVKLLAVADQAVVNGIAQETEELSARQWFVVAGREAQSIHRCREVIQSAVAGGIELEGTLNQGSSNRIGRDPSREM